MPSIKCCIKKIGSIAIKNHDDKNVYILKATFQDQECFIISEKKFQEDSGKEVFCGKEYIFSNVVLTSIENSKSLQSLPAYTLTSLTKIYATPGSSSIDNPQVKAGNHISKESLHFIHGHVTGSYSGVVTSIEKSKFAIFELDSVVELYLCHVVHSSDLCFPLCLGDFVTVTDCHFFSDENSSKKSIICCGGSSMIVYNKIGILVKRKSHKVICGGFFNILNRKRFGHNLLKWLIESWMKLDAKFMSSVVSKKMFSKCGPAFKLINVLCEDLDGFHESKTRSVLQEFMSCPTSCMPLVQEGFSLLFEKTDFSYFYQFPLLDEIKREFESMPNEERKPWDCHVEILPENFIVVGILVMGKSKKLFLQDTSDDIECIIFPNNINEFLNCVIAVRSAQIVIDQNNLVSGNKQDEKLSSATRTYLVINLQDIFLLNHVGKSHPKRTFSSSFNGMSDFENRGNCLPLSQTDENSSIKVSSKRAKQQAGSHTIVTNNSSPYHSVLSDCSNTVEKSNSEIHRLPVDANADWKSSVLSLRDVLTLKEGQIIRNLQCHLVKRSVASLNNEDNVQEKSSQANNGNFQTVTLKLQLSDLSLQACTMWLIISTSVHLHQIQETFGIIPGAKMLLDNLQICHSSSVDDVFCKAQDNFVLKILGVDRKQQLHLKEVDFPNGVRADIARTEQLHPEKVHFLYQAAVKLEMGRSAFIEQKCYIDLILALELQADCFYCGTMFKHNKCGYVGCHSSQLPKFAYQAKCIISDGTAQSKLFVKGDHVKSLLKLDSHQCNILENLVMWQGQAFYNKSFQRNLSQTNDFQMLASLICERPSIHRPVFVKGRPYLKSGNLKLTVFCTEVREITLSELRNDLLAVVV